MQNINTLADIKAGESGVIVKVHGHGGFRHRLLELGFVRGEKVRVIKNAPLMDPIEYEVMNNHVSLRRSEASLIEAVTLDGANHLTNSPSAAVGNNTGTDDDEPSFEQTNTDTNQYILQESHTIRIALVGNPNCGKTSFFNHATGLKEKVGNYSGVTVESKIGVFHHKGYTIQITDLPGTYSLTAFSAEELYVRKYLKEEPVDLVLNIVDASNMERNLFLTTQLIDMNLPMIMALNMYDELEKSGSTLDIKQLSAMLGFPIVPTVSSTGFGIEALLNAIIDCFENKPGFCHHIHIDYGDDIETAITEVKKTIVRNSVFSNRYQAIKLLENDKETLNEFKDEKNLPTMVAESTKWRKKLEHDYDEDLPSLIAEAKYGFIRGALQETFHEGKTKINEKAYKIDRLLTNRWLGFPVLIIFMLVMFQATFSLGAYPQEWIEMGFEWLADGLHNWLPEGSLNDLLTDGVIKGVGGVLVFLPNILILFFFISILEDTGYMARAAFIMDRLMHRMGLHGKSFIPYIIGFGCSVPAIMSTRILNTRKDRIVTMITIPFMSCSAKMPVYLLFVAAFFNSHQGLILLSIYLVGVLMAIATALLLRNTFFAKEEDQFVMELPPYRMPTAHNTMVHMWEKSVFYLKKMGTIILAASVIIWALETYPKENEHTLLMDQKMEQAQLMPEETLAQQTEKEHTIASLEKEKMALQSEHSYIGQLGHFIEPVVAPLGFDWRMGVSILSGFAAKEIIVSSLEILYQTNGDDESNVGSSLRNQTYKTGPHKGEYIFTPQIAYGFLLFILFYFPCVAALSAIRKEGGWRWMFFCMGYNTLVAWIAAWLVHLF